MKKTLYFLLYIGIALPGTLSAQVYADSDRKTEIAFEAGERLEYAVSYKVGFVNVDVATVKFAVSSAKVDGTDCFHIRATGDVNPRYTWFYNLHDVYDTWLDKSNLRPVYFSNDLSEGDYRFRSSYNYDWNTMTVFTKAHNLGRDEVREKRYPISGRSYDAVSLFFNIRSLDVSRMVPDKPYPIEVVFADTVRNLSYRFVGNEKLNIKGVGAINTLVFKCQLADASGNAFEDGSEFTIWISDDRNRIPIAVNSPIKVGSVKVRLTSYKGLRFPLTVK
ncbi:MAG: DUF3108 domain-containing protein [Rikenellaceae bacterium]|nr:DUF3108 domain-containing protein [Rikenellaceae bacterium]